MGEVRPDRDAGGGSRYANRDGNQKMRCRLEAGRSAALMQMKNAAVIGQNMMQIKFPQGTELWPLWIRA
jgi:hypothetical protein